MFVGTQKFEYAILHINAFSSCVKNSEYKYSLLMARGILYPQHFWQPNRHTDSWTSRDLLYYVFPLHLPFIPPPWMCVELEYVAENSPNFPLEETRLSEQPVLVPIASTASSCIVSTVCKGRVRGLQRPYPPQPFYRNPKGAIRASLKANNCTPAECNVF